MEEPGNAFVITFVEEWYFSKFAGHWHAILLKFHSFIIVV